MKNLLKNRNFLTVILTIFIILLILPFSSALNILNEKIKSFIILNLIDYNSWSNNINNDIVVITIDEKTLWKLWRFPFSRSHYKTLIENINLWWAEVIWFDIIFADENLLDIEGDILFSEAIEKAWNVVLGSATITKTFTWETLWIIEKPLNIFSSGAISYWYFSPNIDKRTNIVTSFSPSMKIFDENKSLNTYNHFSITLLKAYFSRLYKEDYLSYENKDENYYYLRPDYPIPFNSKWSNSVLINFISTPSFSEAKLSRFNTYSFIDVYENNINPSVFEWKIVLIWVTAKWIKDTFITYNWIEYWVFVLANIINTILTKNYLLILPSNIEFLLIFLLILLSVYFNLSRSGFVLLASNFSIVIIFLIIFPLSIFVFTSYLLNYLAHLFFALVISLTLSNMVKYITENKNKNKLNKALSEYVSKAIADEILSNSWKVNLDWEKKKLAIYFSDIEWFTSISEKFEPEDLVKFLRDYLSGMSDLIMDSSWFINKYEWDAIMALWGAFIDYDKWWYHACYTSLKQQELLKNLNKRWSKDWFDEVKTRMWIHIWDAIVWNIWSTWRKMEFTALWDSVNLASRLEWVNKFYGTYICVSEDVYTENSDYFEFRYLDKIKVKWKDNPIKIYELLSFKWELEEDKKEIISSFENAVFLYISRDFLWAKNIFSDLISKWDNPSITYLDMCELYIKNPPAEDWEWISVMNSK